MMNHRGSRVVLAVLAATASGCAGRIGHIVLAGTGDACEVTAHNVKVDTRGDFARFRGMAWVVVNNCKGQRDVEVYFKSGSSPLECSKGLTLSSLPEGEVSAIACVVPEAQTKGVLKYKYGVKVGGKTKVDPDLIIKR